MNQQSHGQPGLAQPSPGQGDSGQQGPAQREPGQQVPAGQRPAGQAGAEKDSTGHHEALRGDSPATGHDAHSGTPQGGTPADSAARPSYSSAGGRGPGVRNVAVLGPFTVRDLTVFGATLILFIASLIPMFAVRYNLWNLGSLFFLGLGIVLPLILAALFVARRLAPETKVRIGSLSVDQFGSVVASFAVAFFFLSVAGAFTPSLLVALIGALVLFAATVLASFIPFFAGDFLDRAEVPAHIAARESAVPVRAPKAPQGPEAGQALRAGSDGGRPEGCRPDIWRPEVRRPRRSPGAGKRRPDSRYSNCRFSNCRFSDYWRRNCRCRHRPNRGRHGRRCRNRTVRGCLARRQRSQQRRSVP